MREFAFRWIVPPAILLIATIYSLALVNSAVEQDYCNRSTAEHSDKIPLENPALNAQPNANGNEPENKQDCQESLFGYRVFTDLGAQWIMATGTLGILVFTGWGLCVLRQTYVEARRTRHEAQRATRAANRTTDVTRDIGKMQARAYLTATKVNVSIERFNDRSHGLDGYLTVKLVLKNFGNTVATDVAYRIRAVLSKQNSYRKFVEPAIAELWPMKGDRYAADIFPNEPREIDLVIPKKHLEKFKPPVFLHVYVEVVYHHIGSNEADRVYVCFSYIQPIDLWKGGESIEFNRVSRLEGFSNISMGEYGHQQNQDPNHESSSP